MVRTNFFFEFSTQLALADDCDLKRRVVSGRFDKRDLILVPIQFADGAGDAHSRREGGADAFAGAERLGEVDAVPDEVHLPATEGEALPESEIISRDDDDG